MYQVDNFNNAEISRRSQNYWGAPCQVWSF